MKNLIATLAIMALGLTVSAQTFPAQTTSKTSSATRGGFSAGGTYLSIGYLTGQKCTIISNTVTPVSATHPDTLVIPVTGAMGYGTDTGYVLWSNYSLTDRAYELSVTSLTGTLAGTAILQGSTDGQAWQTMTGNTTYCSACKGASATLSGSGTTTYKWFFPKGADVDQYHQVRVILSGTCTATYSGKMTNGY